MTNGFISNDYAAVSFGKTKLIVIHKGSQLEMFKTKKQALEFIEQHKQDTLKTATLESKRKRTRVN